MERKKNELLALRRDAACRKRYIAVGFAYAPMDKGRMCKLFDLRILERKR